jgi:hypothetical protein
VWQNPVPQEVFGFMQEDAADEAAAAEILSETADELPEAETA